MNLLRGEAVRLLSTRLPLWALVAAVASGAGPTGLLALIGPENATPPLPGIDTAQGVGFVVGLSGLTLFLPALIGTIAITSEFRHRTIGATFLAAPRRGRLLAAKLGIFVLLGLGYGVAMALSAGLALLGAAVLRGATLGVTAGTLGIMLTQLALAAAVYTVLGVAIGALARHQLLAIGIVVGYFYLLEPVLMLVPGANLVYPYLPGGATAALMDFTLLTDTLAEQVPLAASVLVAPVVGAALLGAYALLGSLAAVLVPLQRDLA